MSRKRRGRGEGSICQRSDGLWVARLSLGYDGQGKRLRRVFYAATKAEVQQKLSEAYSGAAAPQGGTLGTYLYRWLNIVKPTVQPNTFRPYERHVKLHIVPRLGGVKLS